MMEDTSWEPPESKKNHLYMYMVGYYFVGTVQRVLIFVGINFS